MATDRVELQIKVTDRFSAGLASVQTKLGRATAAITSMRGALVALGAVTVFTSMIRTMADFEKAMNRVRAVSQATAGQFNALKEQARELGETTVFSAQEVAEGMGFLAQAGFQTNEIIAAMPSTLNLAAAAQLDLATTADIVSNVMQGYGLDASEAGRATDVMTKAFISSNTDLTQLGQAMKFAGPVAKGMGLEFEETAAALGLMGNAGIQATMAGTGLRGALVRLASPTRLVKDTLDELGVSVVNSAGKMDSLVEIVRKLEESGATTTQIMEIFGQRAGPAMAVLIEQGSVALTEFTAKLKDSGGTAKRVADIQLEGLAGALRLLQSAWTEMILVVGDEGGLSIVQTVIEATTIVIRTFTRVVQELALAWQSMIVKAREVIVVTTLWQNELANRNLFEARLEFERMRNAIDGTVPVFDDLNVSTATYNETLKKTKAIVDATTLALASMGIEETNTVIMEAENVWEEMKNVVSDAEEEFNKAAEANIFLGLTFDDLGPRADTYTEAVLRILAAMRAARLETDAFNDSVQDLGDQFDADSASPGAGFGVGDNIVSGFGAGAGLPSIAGLRSAVAGVQAGGPLGAIAGFLGEMLFQSEAFKEAFGAISEVLTELIAPIAEAIAPALMALVPLLEELQPLFNLIGQLLALYLRPLIIQIQIATSAMRQLNEIGFKLVDNLIKLIEFVENLIEALIHLPEQIARAVRDAVKNQGGAVGQGIIDTFRSPFHTGGTLTQDNMIRVPGASPDEGLFFGRVGEEISPRGQGGAGGITIVTAGIDPNEIVRIIEEQQLLGRLR